MPYIPFDTVEDATERTRVMWTDILGRDKHPQDVTEFLYGVIERSEEPDAPELPPGVDVAITIAERDAFLDTLIVDDTIEAREAVECIILYPAWDYPIAYSVDDIVTYDGAMYVVRQAHTSQSDWQPPNVLALYRVYRTDAETLLDWIASESVKVGWQRTYDGDTYECLQAHVTQADWTPDVVPALWQLVAPPTAEWAYPVAYTIGDIVTYGGLLYECRQSHVSNISWTPPAVLALWLPL